MSEKKENENFQKLEFHYIKSRYFRVLHTDGVIANITPKGKISLCLFSERPAIPQTVEYLVDDDGNLSEKGRISRTGYVREMDADIMIDIETAKEIKEVLEATIKEFEEEIES